VILFGICVKKWLMTVLIEVDAAVGDVDAVLGDPCQRILKPEVTALWSVGAAVVFGIRALQRRIKCLLHVI
jgi:hypothetical protein